jgi:hypothetical protein
MARSEALMAGVEPQENGGKAERENTLAHFPEKITTHNSENRRLVRIDYLSHKLFSETMKPFIEKLGKYVANVGEKNADLNMGLDNINLRGDLAAMDILTMLM